MSRLWRTLGVVACLLLPGALAAQQRPFLPEPTYEKLVNEISGDIAYDSLRSLVMYHATSGGNDDFHKEAQWVLDRAKANGLSGDLQYRPRRGPVGGRVVLR